MNSSKKELKLFLEKYIQFGHFFLASNKTSNFYFDFKSAFLSKKGRGLIEECISYELSKLKNVEALAGEGMGGGILASIIASFSVNYNLLIIRTKIKNYGMINKIEGINNIEYGSNVVLIEDVITTGNSVINASNILKEEGFNVSKIICILNRQNQTKNEIKNRTNIDVVSLFKEEDF